jgi:hypothetical protein
MKGERDEGTKRVVEESNSVRAQPRLFLFVPSSLRPFLPASLPGRFAGFLFILIVVIIIVIPVIILVVFFIVLFKFFVVDFFPFVVEVFIRVFKIVVLFIVEVVVFFVFFQNVEVVFFLVVIEFIVFEIVVLIVQAGLDDRLRLCREDSGRTNTGLPVGGFFYAQPEFIRGQKAHVELLLALMLS